MYVCGCYLLMSLKSAFLSIFTSSDVNHISKSFSAPSKKYSGMLTMSFKTPEPKIPSLIFLSQWKTLAHVRPVWQHIALEPSLLIICIYSLQWLLRIFMHILRSKGYEKGQKSKLGYEDLKWKNNSTYKRKSYRGCNSPKRKFFSNIWDKYCPTD